MAQTVARHTVCQTRLQSHTLKNIPGCARVLNFCKILVSKACKLKLPIQTSLSVLGSKQAKK